jgi:hypothetical protein
VVKVDENAPLTVWSSVVPEEYVVVGHVSVQNPDAITRELLVG